MRRSWSGHAAARGVALATLALLLLGGGFLGYVQARAAHRAVLPLPPGPYPVGRRVVTWTEPVSDPLAPRPGPRRISVWLWYPTVGPRSAPARAAYAPGPWGPAMQPGLSGRLLVRPVTRLQVAAQDDAPVAPGRHPLVVLTPGMGNNAVQQTVVASGLAGLGYVVAVPSPTYSADVTVLDGSVVQRTADGQRVPGNEAVLFPLWVHDEEFTADRVRAADADPSSPFRDHVDVARVAYVGHSFGGATAVQACAQDRRCAAAADVDGAFFGAPVTRTGLARPLLVIGSEGSCVTGRCRPDAGGRDELADSRSLLQHSTGVVDVVEVRGARHANFTDLGVWYFAEPARLALRVSGVFGPIDGARALRVEVDCLAAFLDTHLSGAAADRLRQTVTADPEVRVVAVPG